MKNYYVKLVNKLIYIFFKIICGLFKKIIMLS